MVFEDMLRNVSGSGAPVAAADTPFAHEVCGSAARYFTPDDSVALAALMTRLLNTPDERVEMTRQGVDRARLFGWDLEAKRTVDLLVRSASAATAPVLALPGSHGEAPR